MNNESPTSDLEMGTWLSIGSPVVAELAAASGFSWLVLDLEHGNETEAALLSQLRAVQGYGACVVVRLASMQADLVSRVLDWGADGVMVPHVNSAEEAEALVQAAYYSPRGKRGFSRTVRCYGYGLRPPAPGEDFKKPFLLAQIETIEGVANAAAIAAVDGIDSLFVGPADLQHDLQARPAIAAHDFQECLAAVCQAAAEAGKSSGILVRDADRLDDFLAMGFRQIAIDSDLSILRKGYQQIIQSISA